MLDARGFFGVPAVGGLKFSMAQKMQKVPVGEVHNMIEIFSSKIIDIIKPIIYRFDPLNSRF